MVSNIIPLESPGTLSLHNAPPNLLSLATWFFIHHECLFLWFCSLICRLKSHRLIPIPLHCCSSSVAELKIKWVKVDLQNNTNYCCVRHTPIFQWSSLARRSGTEVKGSKLHESVDCSDGPSDMTLVHTVPTRLSLDWCRRGHLLLSLGNTRSWIHKSRERWNRKQKAEMWTDSISVFIHWFLGSRQDLLSRLLLVFYKVIYVKDLVFTHGIWPGWEQCWTLGRRVVSRNVTSQFRKGVD